jgi:glycosyltransferase involved in cell wall biosynthesis
MRVVLIAPDIPDYCIAFAKAVATSCDVLLIAPQSFFKDRPVPDAPGLTVRQVAWPRHRSLRNPVFLLRLFGAIRRYRPDVIHVLNEKNVWLNALLPFLRDGPVVTTVHDVQYHPGDDTSRSVPQWCTRLFVRQSDAIIVHGDSLRRQAAQRLPIAEKAIHVVPHVALTFYRDLATREKLQRARGGAPVVLFFGRIRRYKGVDLLISAANRAASEGLAARFVIAGQSDGETRPLLKKAAPPLFDVRDRFIPDLETAQLFLDADLLVLPYVEASQSGVLAIANSFGLPVVATSVGEIGAAVAESGTGLVVPPNESEALAQALLLIMQDEKRRRAFADKARRFAETESSARAIGARAIAVYKDVLKIFRDPASDLPSPRQDGLSKSPL